MSEIIIVSRHAGAINWLKKHYPKFSNLKHLTHISEEEIKDRIIIGTLPVNLAVLAKEYWHLSMNVPLEMRGKELTVEDMENFNCKIENYKILKIGDNK
nr:MAG: CRISPR-Cas system-associated protein Csx16 [uncultured archaeon]